MADKVDIDELDQLEREATAGPWGWDLREDDGAKYQSLFAVGSGNPDVGKAIVSTYHCPGYYAPPQPFAPNGELVPPRDGKREDATLICALRNAWPSISSELRELRAKVSATENELCALRDFWPKVNAELQELRAKLAEAEQDAVLFDDVIARCRETFEDLPRSVQLALTYTVADKIPGRPRKAGIRTNRERRAGRGGPAKMEDDGK